MGNDNKGKDTPSTNILPPEQMKEGDERPAPDGYPAQPLNLNFEEDPVAGTVSPTRKEAA